MRFAILGPLHVEIYGRHVHIERPRWRSVLTFLLLHNGRPVTTDTMVAAVWGDRPVSTASTQVHAAVSALRRRFRNACNRELIVSGSSGYMMDLKPSELDSAEFVAVVSTTRQAIIDNARSDALRRALGLWRGPALEGVPGAFVEAARTRLEEQRLRVVERLMESELAQGDHGDVAAELLKDVEAHPLRESLVRLYILALYRSGRKSDALREYSRVRQRLTTELGVEPGPELRELYLEILQDNPSARPATPRNVDRVVRGPHTLPPPSPVFTGRSAERARLGGALTERSDGGVTVVALDGPGGVGKSTLAIQVAHDVGVDHPGGQIYVDLQGSSPGLRPLTATEALHRCLLNLRVVESDIPSDPDAAASMLRRLGDNGDLLIVLDNVVDVGQIHPILAALTSGGVVVTSRERLSLPTVNLGFALEPLTPADAVTLLDRVAGRAGADREQFNRIAAYCDHSPLALCVAGSRLAREPDLSQERLAASLADHRDRLTVLEMDGVGVRSSIRVGYDLISAGSGAVDRLAAKAFCAVGLLPLPTIVPGVVAAILCPDEPEAAVSALARLERSRLITSDGAGGYRPHDLVRATAYEYALESMTAAQRTQWKHRAVMYFAACAIFADELLRPGRSRLRHRHSWSELATARVVNMSVAAAEDVGPWLDRALPDIIAVTRMAAAEDAVTAQYAVAIADALSWILRKRGEYHRERALAVDAVAAAENVGDAGALRRALIQRGRVELYLGELDEATTHIDRALASAREDTDEYAQVSALNDLGLAAIRRDDLTVAKNRLLECARLVSDSGVPPHVAPIAMHNIAVVEALLGNWSEAADRLHRALALRREPVDRAGSGSDLVLLGVVECGLREFDDAGLRLREGIDICEGLGDRVDTWFGLAALTFLQLESGRHLEAIAVGQRCLSAARRLNRPYAEKCAHDLLARAHRRAGEDVDARLHDRYARAIDVHPTDPEDRILARLLWPVRSLTRR